MGVAHLCRTSATRRRYVATSDGAGGDTLAVDSTLVFKCRVERANSGAEVAGGVAADAGNRVLLCPPGLDILADDTIVIAGDEYDVYGEPFTNPGPRGAHHMKIDIRLRK